MRAIDRCSGHVGIRHVRLYLLFANVDVRSFRDMVLGELEGFALDVYEVAVVTSDWSHSAYWTHGWLRLDVVRLN